MRPQIVVRENLFSLPRNIWWQIKRSGHATDINLKSGWNDRAIPWPADHFRLADKERYFPDTQIGIFKEVAADRRRVSPVHDALHCIVHKPP